MKAITTKYHGPGNVRGSRFIASDEDGNRVIVSYDYALNSEQNHARAAEALCRKMGWVGTMMGGGIKGGMVWVWTGNGSPVIRVKASTVPVRTEKGAL